MFDLTPVFPVMLKSEFISNQDTDGTTKRVELFQSSHGCIVAQVIENVYESIMIITRNTNM